MALAVPKFNSIRRRRLIFTPNVPDQALRQVCSLVPAQALRQICSTIFAAALLTIVSPYYYHRSGISEIYTVGLEKLFVEVTLAI